MRLPMELLFHLLRMKFREAMRLHRRGIEMDQKTLAKRVKCTRETISNIERGCVDPSLKKAIKIAGILGIDLSQIT